MSKDTEYLGAEITEAGTETEENVPVWNSFDVKDIIALEEIKGKVRSKLWHDIAKHSLAFLIVVPFIILILYQAFTGNQNLIETYYVSIVSAVIGFYFGGRLTNQKD